MVETNLWLFCRIQSNLAPCDSLYAKNAFTVNTHVILDHHYCTHANVSGRNHFVCLACSLYMFCAAPPNPPVTDAHIHTHTSATEPLNFSSVTHFLLGLANPGLCAERHRPWPPQRYDIGCQCGVSLIRSCVLFICTVKSCFHHLGLYLSRTAHNFSLHS